MDITKKKDYWIDRVIHFYPNHVYDYYIYREDGSPMFCVGRRKVNPNILNKDIRNKKIILF